MSESHSGMHMGNGGSSMTMSSLVSTTLATMASTMTTAMSSSSHDHSGMSMSMGSSSSNPTSSAMDMAMQSGATHNHSNSLTSSSSNSTATASTGMDMSSHMGMNYYLTREYAKYPVVFEKLYANSKADAFGIFVLILAAAFCYKFLLFLNWTLEIHWFKKWNKTKKLESALSLKNNSSNINKVIEDDDNMSLFSNGQKTDYDSDATQVYQDNNGLQLTQPLPKMPNLLFDIFAPNLYDLIHDFIRIIIIFTSTMIIYMLMLAAMSFVLTYVFAVVTGLSLSEVFFNRCKTLLLRRWEIQRELDRINKCGGGNNCKCGRHKRVPVITPERDPSALNTNKESVVAMNDGNNKNDNNNQEISCCCNNDNETEDDDRNVERNISETTKLQEQSNDMDANLMPPEKFK